MIPSFSTLEASLEPLTNKNYQQFTFLGY